MAIFNSYVKLPEGWSWVEDNLIITFKFQLLRDPLGKNPHEYYKYPNLRHKQKKECTIWLND